MTQVKRQLVRGVSQPGYSLAAQLNTYHGALLAYLTRLAREITALGTRVEEAAAAAERAADAVREAEVDRQRDLGQLEGRVEELAALLAAAAGGSPGSSAGGDAAALTAGLLRRPAIRTRHRRRRGDALPAVAENLAAHGADVEVLTTCAVDHFTWADHHPEGTRFRVSRRSLKSGVAEVKTALDHLIATERDQFAAAMFQLDGSPIIAPMSLPVCRHPVQVQPQTSWSLQSFACCLSTVTSVFRR